MIDEANPLGVAWLAPGEQGEGIDAATVLGSIFSGTGPYRAIEGPACCRVEHVDPAVTTDGVPRTFTCDRPAGHEGRCRHIYTDDTELLRDGHDPDQAWWVAIEMGAP